MTVAQNDPFPGRSLWIAGVQSPEVCNSLVTDIRIVVPIPIPRLPTDGIDCSYIGILTDVGDYRLIGSLAKAVRVWLWDAQSRQYASSDINVIKSVEVILRDNGSPPYPEGVRLVARTIVDGASRPVVVTVVPPTPPIPAQPPTAKPKRGRSPQPLSVKSEADPAN